MARSRSVLCPYCFSRWRTNVAAFRCMSRDETRCTWEPDEALGRLLESDSPRLPRVLTLKGSVGQAFRVKPGKPVRCECGAHTRPVCPNCHHELPQRFAEAPSHSLALIGTKASGKSNYIAVTLHELEHRIGPRFGGSLMLLDDATRTRVSRDLVPRIYQQGHVLEPTQSAATDRGVRDPIVSRLTLGQGRKATHSNLVFFDAAGEDLDSLDVLEREARYISQSDGLILLVDPLQIPSLRDELDGSVELPELASDPYTMLGRVAGLLRQARAVKPGRQIDVPLALAVSKLDVLRPVLPDTHPVFALPEHDGRFDAGVMRSVSAALRADLEAWLGAGFDRFAQSEFTAVEYFGLSALGEQPEGGRLRNGVSPHRVEDPILWLLDNWKAIPN